MVAAVRGRGQTNGNSTGEEISSPCFFLAQRPAALAQRGREVVVAEKGGGVEGGEAASQPGRCGDWAPGFAPGRLIRPRPRNRAREHARTDACLRVFIHGRCRVRRAPRDRGRPYRPAGRGPPRLDWSSADCRASDRAICFLFFFLLAWRRSRPRTPGRRRRVAAGRAEGPSAAPRHGRPPGRVAGSAAASCSARRCVGVVRRRCTRRVVAGSSGPVASTCRMGSLSRSRWLGAPR